MPNCLITGCVLYNKEEFDAEVVGTDEAFDDAFSQLLQRIVQLAPTVHAPDRSS